MKRISGSTVYYKKVFPGLWFGFLGIFFISSLGSVSGVKSVPFLLFPLLMAGFGYFLFKKMVWDLVDDVFDHGASLEFRKNGKVQRVALQEVINIDYTQMAQPERVVVHVKNDGPIGKELAFALPMRFATFSKNPLVRELIERVDNARNN